MKDYKCFFINTWSFMSLLDNHQLKIFTNVQMTIQWYQIRMTSLQEGTQVLPIQIKRSHNTAIIHNNYFQAFLFFIVLSIKRDWLQRKESTYHLHVR